MSFSTTNELFHDKIVISRLISVIIPQQRSFSTTKELFHDKWVFPRQKSYSTTVLGHYSMVKEFFHDKGVNLRHKGVVPRQKSYSTTYLSHHSTSNIFNVWKVLTVQGLVFAVLASIMIINIFQKFHDTVPFFRKKKLIDILSLMYFLVIC